MNRRLIIVCLIAAAGSLTGCAKKIYYIDFDRYPQLPITGTSKVFRKMAEARPDVKKELFYGDYGGPGNNGTKPNDEMDRLFYEHDRAYIEGYRLRHLRDSDRKLVAGLKAIDEETLTPEALAYRNKAIKFFESPMSAWVGKPRDVRWGMRGKKRVFDMSEYPGTAPE